MDAREPVRAAESRVLDWPADAARAPEGLSPERAWRWCMLRTLRDMRLAVRRGRAISRPNARRLIQRRWRPFVPEE
jgi:hypothetical protein